MDFDVKVDDRVIIDPDALASIEDGFTADGPVLVLTLKVRSNLILVQNDEGQTHWFKTDCIHEFVGPAEPGTAEKVTGRSRRSKATSDD